jgi:hypothetical protein
MGTAQKRLQHRHRNRQAPHSPRLLTLPPEIRHTIFSYFLGRPVVRYTTFHGKRNPLEEGCSRNGKFVSSYYHKPRIGPWDHVSKTLRDEFHSYSWTHTQLVIDSVYDLKHFIDDYHKFKGDIRTVTLKLATNSYNYGGYTDERTDSMALLHRNFVNITELNLYCVFENWGSEEKAGRDDFRLMPFFQSLQPFPQLKVFRLLDDEDSLGLWPDNSPNALTTMNDWMMGKLSGMQNPIQTQASHNSRSSATAERYLYMPC